MYCKEMVNDNSIQNEKIILYIPDLTVNATVYNLHYHVMSKDLSVCKPDVDAI